MASSSILPLGKIQCDNLEGRIDCATTMQHLPEGWKPSHVAIDIDGTITDEKKLLDGEAIEALRKLEQSGIPVILSTGNVRAIAYGLWRFIGLSGPMCCENGGVLWDESWQQPLVRADPTEAKKAAEWLASQIDGLDPNGIETNHWRESEWCLRADEPYELICELLKNSQFAHLSTVRTGFAIHLMDGVLSKGQGLKVLFQLLSIDPAEVLAIGDAPNDISMFELCGHSIAVSSEFDEVVDAAKTVSHHQRSKAIAPIVDEILKA